MAVPPPISADAPLILASGSRYRADLLRRLRLPFVQESPEVDESALPGEEPAALARRLALLKAGVIAARRPGCWVLGSDQVCACGPDILGKPGSHEQAVRQLCLLSGKSARFFTAVVLACSTRPSMTALDLATVRFRELDAAEIGRYLDAEPAYDCAGSFKSEGLGIALCEAIETSDPSGLVGLPLIAVRRLLAQAGSTLP
jgi:septum formation protein